MGTSALTFVLAIIVNTPAQASAPSGAIKQEEIDYQNQNFQQWWDTDLVWKFDDLPTEGGVQKFRIPYSGCDYTDRGGGTMAVLRKYDLAFNRGAFPATEWEREDVGRRPPVRLFRRRWGDTAGMDTGSGRVGFFRRLFGGIGTPSWHGHCNGRTAASIRHAEPQSSVRRNGVVFTPADIKGLLAEVYMYSETEFLGGIDYAVNPGTFHVIISNWLGRGSHPVGMDTTLGEVVFNYPIYAYATSHRKQSGNRVDVKMNARYAKSSGTEYDRSPHRYADMYFHYRLDLNEEGEITGGRYYGDSARVDMLWAPQQPVQGGEEGNELGNPYVDVKEVLAIWRESVPEELRNKWYNIDPTDEDRIVEPEEEEPVAEAEDSEDTGGEETEADEQGDTGGQGDTGDQGETSSGAEAEESSEDG
jgi:hypothetical protein